MILSYRRDGKLSRIEIKDIHKSMMKIKHMVDSVEGVYSPFASHFYFLGKIVDYEKTLQQCNITENDVLMFVSFYTFG